MLSQTSPKKVLLSLIRPLLAVLGAVIVSALFLLVFGYSPIEAAAAMWESSFKNLRTFGNLLNNAAPLLFTGLAVAVAYRSSVFNIGAEGQFLLGAVAATWVGITFTSLPGFILIPAMLIAGTIAGAAWAFIPAFLKAKYAISEIITTIMFSYIALQLVGFLVRSVMRDTEQAEPQSYTIAEQGFLPYPITDSKAHPGFFVGIIIAILLFIFLFKTYHGFELRAVGFNNTASRYAGISVTRVTISTMLISGGLAGLGGAFVLTGSTHYLLETISSGYGYTAIAVSILVGNNPIGVIFSSLLFGFLSTGAQGLQRDLGLSASFASIMQGIIIIFVAVAAVNQGVKKHKADKKPKLDAAKEAKKEG